MHSTFTTTMLPGLQTLFQNPNIESAIATIVAELRDAQSGLTAAQPPQADLIENYQDYLDRIATTRGKPALYPYIGSGLGNGPLVQLADGSVKWDMINGIGVHMFGHSDPDMIETAIRAALSDVVMQGNLQFNADSIEFSEVLLEQAKQGSNLAHAFLTNSGAMANESALKVCMQKKGGAAPRVIAFADCFMGRSTTMVQIGDSAAGRAGVPLNTLVDYMPFFDPEQPQRSTEIAVWHLEQTIARYPGQHCCFVFELVQGEGGFNVAPREFFVALMNVCRKHSIPIWVDEVQTFGRTERMFYFQQLDLGENLDVVTIGKMSQACACLYTAEFNPKPGLLSGTFISSSESMQVGKRVLERLREGDYYGSNGRIAQLQQSFRDHCKRLVENNPQWFPDVPHPFGLKRTASGLYGGVGGMMRFTPFGGDKGMILKALHAMFDRGVIAFYCGHGPYHVRFLPPIGVMKPNQFGPVFEIVAAALNDAAGAE